MLCPNCNQEFDSKFCPGCGYSDDSPATAATPPSQPKPPKKKLGCLPIILVVVGVFVVLVVVGALSGSNPDTAGTSASSISPAPSSASASPAPSSTPAPPPAPTTTTFSAELSDGHYTAGIDFPEGKYNVTCVSGKGNAHSSNAFSGGLNLMMGIVGKDDIGAEMYEQEFKNAQLSNDTVLSISGGLTILISSENASTEPLVPRNQGITETVNFGSGNYTVGEDFPAGVYDIVAVSGSGNVSGGSFSSGINAVMGVDVDPAFADMYQQQVKNVLFEDGDTLKITGIEVLLTPSK